MAAVMVVFDEAVYYGSLKRRYQRFFMDVLLDSGELVVAHNPNTGSMLGLIDEGNRVMLTKTKDSKRRTQYTAHAVMVDGAFVGINTHLPNKLIKQSLAHPLLHNLKHYQRVQSEKPFGPNLHSRVDLHFSEGLEPDLFLEIKNVTLKVGHEAQFPDAISTRAHKHVEDLLYVLQQGFKAALYFVVQRTDCKVFTPARHIDARYAEALSLAVKKGLSVRALVASISAQGLWLSHELPCRWE